MKNFLFLCLILISSESLNAKTFNLPEGKGLCPKFSFKGEDSWTLKSDRPKGDRWILRDDSKNINILRFDYKVSSTDQKQLPEVEEKILQLGDHKVSKYTVTTAPEKEKAVSGLITSYNFETGKLAGLVVMTEEYEKASELDKKIESMLKTIRMK